MNYWRWTILFSTFGNVVTLWKWVHGGDYGMLWITITILAFFSQVLMFCFMKSPFKKDGQGGNLQLTIRTRRHPQR